jgi:heme exporter protein B
LGQSIVMEHEDGCWEGLLRYPVAAETVFLAKLTVNSVILGSLQLIVVPFFAVVSDSTWLSHPVELLLINALGNLGICSVGTLLGAISTGAGFGQALLALWLLPLLVPVVLAASEATRTVADQQLAAQWWQWVQLLAAFAIIYVTAGWVLFEYVIEE